MTDHEKVDDFIARDDAAGLREWELENEIKDEALLEKIDAFLKSKGLWYGDNAHRRGQLE